MAKTIAFVENESVECEGKPVYVNSLDLNLTSIHDYALNFEHNKELYKPYWLQTWSEKTKINGKTLKEHFTYKNQTLWYFFEYIIYVEGKMPHNSMSLIIYYIDLVNEILKKENPKEVIIQNNKEFFYRVVEKVCKQKKIKIVSLNYRVNTNLYEKITENIFLLKNYFKFKIFLRRLVGLFSKKNNTKTDVLILSNERFCNKTNYKNLFWGTIIRELEKENVKYNVLEYDMIWNIKSLKKMFNRHILKKYPKTKYLGEYYNSKTWKETKNMVKFVEDKWNKIRTKQSFIKSLEYRGVNIHELCEKRFEMVLGAFSYFIGDDLAVTEHIVKKEKPKTVLMDHEMNFYGVGFLIQSKKYDLKTIALQFESVNKSGSVIRYINSKKILNKNKYNWRPIADIKCASGNYAKKVLVEMCNIPSKTIKITGQPRYDSFAKSSEYDKSTIYKELGLDSKKKTIVYATKFRTFEKQIWDELKSLPKNYQVVFKLAYSNDLSFYEKNIGKQKNVIITKDYNLNKVLAIADLLVTIRSTVAMEAMCMNTPVMLADFHNTCTFPYVELGAAVKVNSVDEIQGAIKKCVTDKNLQKKLKKGREKFIKNYLYKQDGKASRRIVDILVKY